MASRKHQLSWNIMNYFAYISNIDLIRYELFCLHFKYKENITKNWKNSGKINIDGKILKGVFNILR